MAERLTPENARLDRWMARQAQLELEVSDLTAKLAEVEAERYNLQCTVDYDLHYQRELEARLAAVEALCDRWETANGDLIVDVDELRAAARGRWKAPAPIDQPDESC